VKRCVDHEVRELRLSPLALLLTLGACTSVLGIEELHQDPRSGSAGGASTSGGTASGGKDDDNRAGSATDPSAGKSGSDRGGSAQGGSQSQSAGRGGNGGSDTASAGSSAGGAGGTPEPASGPVHGTLIDFWGRPLSNVLLQIDDETATTDRDGKFDFANDVAAEYEVSLRIDRESGSKIQGWVFQGLTRRDPTLQIYQGREDRGTTGYATVTAEDTLGASDTISGVWGTSDGSWEKSDLDTSANGNYFSPEWQGGTSIMGTAHALLWTKNTANEQPSAYRSYDSKLIAVQEGTDASMSFTLKTMTIMTGNVAGTVSPIGNGDRTNGLFVRFNSGGTLTLVKSTPQGDTFSYLVPKLEEASISVAASEVDGSDAFSVVHKDGLSPGDSAGTLTIPAPATLLEPRGTAADAVDDTTSFSFRGSKDSAGGYVVHIEADKYYQSLYIVTHKTTFTLPKVLGGSYQLTPARVYRWTVETHGAFATVDQMAQPGGFLDAYSGPTQYTEPGEPAGTKQVSGSYTCTSPGYFTFK